MLVILEENRVIGRKKDEFEETYRRGWLKLRDDPDLTPLWYFDVVHGAGPSYRVLTVTAIPDGAAFERVNQRVAEGDLTSWVAELDSYRYESVSRVVTPMSWSPLRELPTDLADISENRQKTFYWYTRGWPHLTQEEYMRFLYERWYKPDQGVLDGGVAEVDAFFETVWGSGRKPEGIELAKIISIPKLQLLLQEDESMQMDWRADYLQSGLEVRDKWDTTLLRTSPWSPLGS